MGVHDEEEPVLLDGSQNSNFHEEYHRVISKVTWRVLPLVWSLWFFAHMSRSNLTNMHMVMMRDIKLTEFQFGISLGAFYISYVIFQMPSNLMIERLKVNVWLAILVLAWGLVTTFSVFTYNAPTLVTTRFCLGVAEAGISPGIVYYITVWFGEKHRGQKLAILLTALPVAYAICGIISSLVLDHMDGVLGLCGWRWLYIFTGVPTIVLSGIFYLFLPNTPQEALFLTDRERKVLFYERSIAAAVWTAPQRTTTKMFINTLQNPRNWLMALCGMFFVVPISGIDGFAPAILYELGSEVFSSNFLIAIPNLSAVCCLLIWSYHSDRQQERFWHIFVAMLIALITLACCIFFVFSLDLGLVLGLLTIYQSSVLSGHTVFIAYMCGSVLGSTSVAIGLFYSVAAFGGWLGPFLMGLSRDRVGDHVLSLSLMCGAIALGIGTLSLLYVTQRNMLGDVGMSKITVREPIDGQDGYSVNGEDGEKSGGAAILI